jgi:uncharacterized protein YsxB (DUF464 family)
MTNIRCDNDREEYTIDIEGHADFNPGNDIVCSAASILAYTLENALANKAESQLTVINDTDNGEIHIKVKSTRDNIRDIRTIITTIMTGYELLEEQYVPGGSFVVNNHQ